MWRVTIHQLVLYQLLDLANSVERWCLTIVSAVMVGSFNVGFGWAERCLFHILMISFGFDCLSLLLSFGLHQSLVDRFFQ